VGKLVEIRYIVIHHSATRDGETMSWPAIRRFHTTPPPDGRGWADIGYHIGIEQIAQTWEVFIGRPWTVAGAHAPGRNSDSLGICLVGDFDQTAVPAQQWAAAVRLVRWLRGRFTVPVDRVVGHREVQKGRTCPGRYFDLAAFRDAVAKG